MTKPNCLRTQLRKFIQMEQLVHQQGKLGIISNTKTIQYQYQQIQSSQPFYLFYEQPIKLVRGLLLYFTTFATT